MSDETHRGGLVGPLILIAIGAIVLLNNVGVTTIGIWETIVRGWPLLLIAIGIDLLIPRRSALASVVTLIVILVVLVGGLFLVSTSVAAAPGGEQAIRRSLGGAQSAEVSIEQPAGVLRLRGQDQGSTLIEGEIGLARGEQLQEDFEVEGGIARYSLQSSGVRMGPFVGTSRGGMVWDLSLSQGVPLDLVIQLAAGDAQIDLRRLELKSLEISNAVGQATVTLPNTGRFEGQISLAVGQLIVVIPEGMEARLQIDSALTGRNLPGSFRGEGNTFTSPGYQGADDRVDLKLSLPLGNIVVRYH